MPGRSRELAEVAGDAPVGELAVREHVPESAKSDPTLREDIGRRPMGRAAHEEDGGTVQTPVATGRLGERERAVRGLAPARDLVALEHLEGGSVLGPCQHELSAPIEGMVHEEPPDQIVFVAQAVE